MSKFKYNTFNPLFSVFIRGVPTQPHPKCVFYHYFKTRKTEWHDFRRIVLLIFIIWAFVLILGFLTSKTVHQVGLIVLVLTALTSFIGFFGVLWYRNESIFRYIVERCRTLLRRPLDRSEEMQFIAETEDRIEKGRLS